MITFVSKGQSQALITLGWYLPHERTKIPMLHYNEKPTNLTELPELLSTCLEKLPSTFIFNCDEVHSLQTTAQTQFSKTQGQTQKAYPCPISCN